MNNYLRKSIWVMLLYFIGYLVLEQSIRFKFGQRKEALYGEDNHSARR